VLLQSGSLVTMNNEQIAQLFFAMNLALQQNVVPFSKNPKKADYTPESHHVNRIHESKHQKRNFGKGKFRREKR
jgi:hypothetical protein